eukprot:3173492-Pyramimonas_sp.AAC.1
MYHVSTELARRTALHAAARTACAGLQDSQALRRALMRKPRVARANNQKGDPAFYWRLRTGPSSTSAETQRSSSAQRARVQILALPCRWDNT